MALLELQNITAGYDKNVILKDLNFQVEKERSWFLYLVPADAEKPLLCV